MRVESILGAFVIMLGNFVLHFILFGIGIMLSVPDQKFIDEVNRITLNSTKTDNTQCISSTSLRKLLYYANIVHAVACVLLFYQNIHQTIWLRCIKLCANCKSSKPEFEDKHVLVLNQGDTEQLKQYSK